MPFNNEIEKTKKEIEVLTKKLSFLEELERTKTPCEEAYKKVFGFYPKGRANGVWTIGDQDVWSAFQAGYNSAYAEKEVEVEEEPEETEQSLKEAFREVQQTEEWKETQKKIDSPKESWMNRPINELVDILEKNPPECLSFELGETLYDICVEWCDDDSQPTVSELIDRIEKWLPHEQDSSSSQRIETLITVDVHNRLLRKIKSKLRNRD